jgi:hypothetical protein
MVPNGRLNKIPTMSNANASFSGKPPAVVEVADNDANGKFSGM